MKMKQTKKMSIWFKYFVLISKKVCKNYSKWWEEENVIASDKM